MGQTRRSFLRALGLAAAGVAVGHAPAAATPLQRRKLERIGLQLYTIRSTMRAVPPATPLDTMARTLQSVAEIGYKEVEFAGYNGLTAPQIRELLTRYGLTSPSTHVGLNDNAAEWDAIVANAAAIGHQYITIPSLPRGFDAATVDGWKSLAARFNKAGSAAKTAGLKLAFHNHNSEFREVQGQVPFDILIQETDPELVSFQIDLHWMTVGGKDALDYYQRFPTRFPMVHVKDSAGPPQHRMVDVGAGTINFAAIFAKAVTSGTKHFFVEHDSPADPMASVRASYNYLVRLEF